MINISMLISRDLEPVTLNLELETKKRAGGRSLRTTEVYIEQDALQLQKSIGTKNAIAGRLKGPRCTQRSTDKDVDVGLIYSRVRICMNVMTRIT